MRASLWSLLVVVGVGSSGIAQERFVERTPYPRNPVFHTMERAGNPTSVKPRAVPSVTAHDATGYVGGAKLLGNNLRGKGSGAASGPIQDGTFATDYAGAQLRTGRVFLAPSYDRSIGPTVARAYRTDGPHVPDVFSLRPLRKAVLEKRDVMDSKHGE